MNPEQTCDLIKAALAGMNFRVYEWATLDPIEPAVVIYPETFPITETWKEAGFRRPVFVIRCYAPYTNDRAGTRLLYEWTGTGTANSIADALADSDSINCSIPTMRNWTPLASQTGSKIWLTAELVFDVF